MFDYPGFVIDISCHFSSFLKQQWLLNQKLNMPLIFIPAPKHKRERRRTSSGKKIPAGAKAVLGGNIRYHHECEGGIGKSVPRINVRHHEACVMTNDDPWIEFSIPTLIQIMDSFSCSPLNTAFVFQNKFAEVLEYAELHCYMMKSL